MGDLFSLLLESFLDWVISKFGFIDHPVARGIVQVVVMIAICAIIIGLVILVVGIVKYIKNS